MADQKKYRYNWSLDACLIKQLRTDVNTIDASMNSITKAITTLFTKRNKVKYVMNHWLMDYYTNDHIKWFEQESSGLDDTAKKEMLLAKLTKSANRVLSRIEDSSLPDYVDRYDEYAFSEITATLRMLMDMNVIPKVSPFTHRYSVII